MGTDSAGDRFDSDAGPRPPKSIEELLERARRLEGVLLSELRAGDLAFVSRSGRHTKGKTGEILERLLGATGGSRAMVDFPDLGIELKTLPVDERGKPRESTFVCTVRLEDADRAEWETAWVREKLLQVLFVPIVDPVASKDGAQEDRTRIGTPFLWRPSEEEAATLRADFEDIIGLVGAGRIEEVSAHLGEILQLRPKAKDGSARVLALGPEGERLETVPRGFYLRPRFTETLLRRATEAISGGARPGS